MDARSCGMLLALPLADTPVVGRVDEMSLEELALGIAGWIRNAESIGWLRTDSVEIDSQFSRVSLNLTDPIRGSIIFHLRPTARVCADIASGGGGGGAVSNACNVFVASEPGPWMDTVDASDAIHGTQSGGVLVLPPEWVAAMAVEQRRPLLFSDAIYSDQGEAYAAADLVSPYFWDDVTPDLDASGLSILRSSPVPGSSIGSSLLEDETSYQERLRVLKRESPPSQGTVLLASVFLPPVTHSVGAVERFYLDEFGLSSESIPLVRERYLWERQEFHEHIARHHRIDIVDRAVLLEYLAAPEYYQMRLRASELHEQIDNVLSLLAFENYTLCLTPEAIDLSFEIRAGKLRIRTDRRNKGRPRQGRVSSLTFESSSLAEAFEREFWSLYRLTEPEFKDRKFVSKWLMGHAAAYSG